MKIEVRQATKADLMLLLDFFYENQSFVFDSNLQLRFEEILAQSNYYIYIASLNSMIVGAVNLMIMGGLGQDFPCAVIEGLKISGKYENAKIAACLLRECEYQTQRYKCKKITSSYPLEVNRDERNGKYTKIL